MMAIGPVGIPRFSGKAELKPRDPSEKCPFQNPVDKLPAAQAEKIRALSRLARELKENKQQQDYDAMMARLDEPTRTLVHANWDKPIEMAVLTIQVGRSEQQLKAALAKREKAISQLKPSVTLTFEFDPDTPVPQKPRSWFFRRLIPYELPLAAHLTLKDKDGESHSFPPLQRQLTSTDAQKRQRRFRNESYGAFVKRVIAKAVQVQKKYHAQ